MLLLCKRGRMRYQKGIELIKQAIKAENPKGYNVMGLCYKRGIGVERNLEKALNIS